MERTISTATTRSPSAASFVRPSAGLARRFAAMAAATEIPFRVVMSDGTVIQGRDEAPAFTLTFRTRAAERRAIAFGYVGLLESYFEGSADIDGNLALAFRAGYEGGLDQGQTPLVRLHNEWLEHRYSNRSLTQAQANARFHYGLSQEFYRPWLDHPSMMYTCAYWKEGTHTLEEAQRNKMDHVCRKVQLKAGESFVDIGSGWGGLLFHAWEHYGALGTGINPTTAQVTQTRKEIESRGLAEKIRVIECDFRKIPGQYDKLLSIGTLEHAGRDQLPEVVRAHANALEPGGLGVIHFIGHVGERDTELFIRKYIFPGGWIPSLSTAIDWMERCGLEILDIENLRRHYALTLDVWAERFDRNWDAIQSLDPERFDERFRRIWRTYLWSCAEAFRTKTPDLNLFQVTVSKNSVGSSYPMSRSFLY